MDIYKFFNSKDEAEYLKSMDYQFTLPEAAYIISQSVFTTLEERIGAWQELIDTTPDCSMGARFNLEPIGSFHAFLRDYIRLQRKIIRLFHEPGKAVYTYQVYEKDFTSREDRYEGEYYDFAELGEYFGTAEMAFARYTKNEEDHREDGVKRVRFHRYGLVTDPAQNGTTDIWLETDPQMHVLTLDAYGGLNEREQDLQRAFEGMYFIFPTPFHTGDILINPVKEMYHSYLKGPFVLETMATWGSKELKENGIPDTDGTWAKVDARLERQKESADDSDMNYSGCFLMEEESCAPMPFWDTDWTNINLARYEGPLNGIYRLLKPISQMMITDPKTGKRAASEELCCNAYHQIITEEMCKKERESLETWYTEEGLELAGLK